VMFVGMMILMCDNMKYFLNPSFEHKDSDNPEEILTKDSHYSAIVIGSENFFEFLNKHIKLEPNEIIAGASISDENLINVFIKSKNPKPQSIIVDKKIETK
jgi:hypothetical protein